MSQSIVVFSYDVACEMAREGKWNEVVVRGGGESWWDKTLEGALKIKDWERPGMLAESFEFMY
jgi:hypothetical protein